MTGRAGRAFGAFTDIDKQHPNAALYTKLFALKQQNQALWNGEMVQIYNDRMDKTISFARERNGAYFPVAPTTTRRLRRSRTMRPTAQS